MVRVLEWINQYIWGIPTLTLILLVGLMISFRTGFVQLTMLPKALSTFWHKLTNSKASAQGVSPYQALCTALAATVGTGNIAGVAGAIAIGGPGAIFWMWICALLGMGIKFAEATLAVRYRTTNLSGERIGGPMYMICRGLGKTWTPLASLYAFFAVVAAFGVGNATQVNAVIGGINSVIEIFGGTSGQNLNLMIGIILAVLTAFMLTGGARRIGSIAEGLVPIMSLAYIALCAGVLLVRWNHIGPAFAAIIQGAFSPDAVTGGAIGSFFICLRTGVSRGIFTNEAGMGTASIAHAAADVRHPVEQGLMGIMEVFLDTIVICTLTGFVILCSGVTIPYGIDTGVQLTADAFSAIYGPWIKIPLMLALCCFAIATILGWGLYGARCAQFLFGEKVWRAFTVMQVLTVLVGAVLQTGTVWLMSEMMNGLMAIPNLIALAFLSPELVRLTKEFRAGRLSAAGGNTNEDIHQCKPLRTFSHAEVSSAGS